MTTKGNTIMKKIALAALAALIAAPALAAEETTESQAMFTIGSMRAYRDVCHFQPPKATRLAFGERAKIDKAGLSEMAIEEQGYEPPRVCRRLISSNHAAMADCSSAA
jgi:hypothetical protein